MDDDGELGNGISRRQALRRIGAGAAIAWSTPALIHVARASAQTSPVASHACPGPCTTFPGNDCEAGHAASEPGIQS